jgi:AcrR family transcriptional regulator
MDSHSALAPSAPIAARKTPRQGRSAATVAAILEAAARILDEAGLEAFNTNAVAARAGVSVGSLYQYFPGKAAVLAALIAEDFRVFEAALAGAAAGGGFEAELAALVRVAVAHQTTRPRLARLLDFAEARMDMGEDVARRQGAILAHVEAFLARHRERLAVEDIRTAAMDCMAIARGLIDTAAEGRLPPDAALEARVVRALAGYLTWPYP